MSLIGGRTKGDSNSSDGEESEFTGEERRSNGALFEDAPKVTHVELLPISYLIAVILPDLWETQCSMLDPMSFSVFACKCTDE